MTEYQFSEHAYDMLRERQIREEWVNLAVEDPDKEEVKEDGTVHYIRAIQDHGGRYLRVVINPHVQPRRIVTVSFDRRIGRLG